MAEPEKPFACTFPECCMSFTNEDHLNVHTKKHDMILQLGIEQKAAFVADQTPTPTRFIRNCEEVGLFQDLQSVNPFDEGFKRAMEAKQGLQPLEPAADDGLHTPQMVFPLLDGVDSVYSTTNNQRNITISRSSSDESGAVKEYETTTISKLTNKVTTISRLVGKQDSNEKLDDNRTIDTQNKDIVNETSVSYTNNVIIHSNVEIRTDAIVNKDNSKTPVIISYKDSLIKDATSVITKDVIIPDPNKLQVKNIQPIMSQKSLDLVVDSFTSDPGKDNDGNKSVTNLKRDLEPIKKESGPKGIKKTKMVQNKTIKQETKAESDAVVNLEDTSSYEVFISLPNGKQVRMKPVDGVKTESNDKTIQDETKEKIKNAIAVKKEMAESHKIVQIPIAGTLYPVTVVNPLFNPVVIGSNLQNIKLPIKNLNAKSTYTKPVSKYDTKSTDISKRFSENVEKNNEKCLDVNKTSSNIKCKTSVSFKSKSHPKYIKFKIGCSNKNSNNNVNHDANKSTSNEITNKGNISNTRQIVTPNNIDTEDSIIIDDDDSENVATPTTCNDNKLEETTSTTPNDLIKDTEVIDPNETRRATENLLKSIEYNGESVKTKISDSVKDNSNKSDSYVLNNCVVGEHIEVASDADNSEAVNDEISGNGRKKTIIVGDYAIHLSDSDGEYSGDSDKSSPSGQGSSQSRQCPDTGSTPSSKKRGSKYSRPEKCEASRRYRAKKKQFYEKLQKECYKLTEKNKQLKRENSILKSIIQKHAKECHHFYGLVVDANS